MSASLPIHDVRAVGEKTARDPRRHLLDTTLDDLRAWIVNEGQKPFRAGQIWKWVFERRAESFGEMTDLPQALRDRLDADFKLFACQIVKHQKSNDGTEKFLIGLHHGGEVECVLLREDDRRSICVSS
ncbi:MAG: 23S rRNA (adenine(2503)-C(2))-methyltransferase RlmN, partial [Planctomycetaceae bacterium]